MHHTNYSTRLDDLQQRVATVRSAVQTAASESDAQLKERIDRAQADLDQSVDSARAKWAQLKADAAAKMSDVKANIDKRTRHVDAKVAADDADWAEADAAEALDFA